MDNQILKINLSARLEYIDFTRSEIADLSGIYRQLLYSMEKSDSMKVWGYIAGLTGINLKDLSLGKIYYRTFEDEIEKVCSVYGIYRKDYMKGNMILSAKNIISVHRKNNKPDLTVQYMYDYDHRKEGNYPRESRLQTERVLP
jgi:hypothetical protein